MPRSTFSAGMFRAATPGMSRLAASLGGADQAYQQAYDNTLGLQSKMAQALAAAREHDAKAAVEETKNSMLTGRPALVEELAAGTAGTDVPMVKAIRQMINTGQAPQVPMGPPTQEGAMGVGSEKFDPAVQSKVVQALSRLAPVLMGAGDVKIDDWAKAQQMNRESDLSDRVIADPTQAGNVFKGQASAGAGANPLFHQDTTGAVLDLGTGGIDTSNPMAGATIGLRNAQGNQAKAAAVENYAQAGSANAAAALRKRQAEAVGSTGGGRIPIGYRYVADEDTGSVKLEPIPGGPKDPNAQTGKPMPATVGKSLLENQTNLRRAETALALIEGKSVGGVKGDPNATGWKGYTPNVILNRMDKAGVATRAAIADLGSLVIHDRSGAAVTAAEFPRLAPFIPTEKDDPATVKKKLEQFVRNYRDEVGGQVDFYRASGFNVPADQLRGATVTEPPAAPGAGFKYLGTEN